MDRPTGSGTPGKLQKRKHVTLSLDEKMEIILRVEAGEMSYEQIAAGYGIAASTIVYIMKQKGKIRAKVAQSREHGENKRRTLKEQNFPLLEEALFVWILQQRSANILNPADVMKAKAISLFETFKQHGCYEGSQFQASNGWARRFRERFGLRTAVASGEKASANIEAYIAFKSVLMAKIIEMGLSPAQIFNADESALFIKLIASKTVILWDEKAAAGRKLNRTRYTFMPCANMDGSLKMKLMFIGTAENPRDLPRNKDTLPVSYYHAKKAWMTRSLFRRWFYEEFVPAVRAFSAEKGLEPKALLVLDNCSAHHMGCDLQSDDGLIQVIYLPPNVTSVCQPLDQSVINAVKTRYKRKLMLKLVLENEHLSFNDRLKKITLGQCIDWLSSAWDEISPTTLKNSWEKLIDEFPEYEFPDAEATEEDLQGDIKLLVAAADKVAGTSSSEEDIDRWLNDQVVDSQGNLLSVTSYQYTDEEIINSVMQKQVDATCTDEEWLDHSNGNLEESSMENERPLKGFSEALESLSNVIEFVQDDPQEVANLVALRNKLIEKEWKKRNN